jgi:iron complex outermembrane receptor protein
MFYIDQVFPLDIAGVEVVRGTSDPRHGLHNIAGNANIITRIGGTYLDARLSAGSYSTYEGQASAGYRKRQVQPELPGRLSRFGRFRDHADLDRLSLAGKWFYNFSDDVSLGLIARHYEIQRAGAGLSHLRGFACATSA